MIKFIYGYYNKLGEFFGVPFYEDHSEKEMPSVIRQALFNAKEADILSFKECELYCLGTFDNETGVFETKKEFIMNCASVAEEVLGKRGGQANA